MSFKSEDLLNLSLELAKESSNRIVENQKLKILNLKEKKNRELNEERMIKYFEDNYLKINDKIDGINDEIQNIHDIIQESKSALEKSDSLINKKINQIEETKTKLDEKVGLISKKIEEQYILEKNSESNKEEIIKIQNEISLIERDVEDSTKTINQYNQDLENLKKAKVAFEISFYLDSIRNVHNTIYSKAEGFAILYKNAIASIDTNKQLFDEFEKLILDNSNIKDNLDNYARITTLREQNNKKFQNNDIEKIKLTTAKLEIDNIVKKIKTLTTDDFDSVESTKKELDETNQSLVNLEKYIANVQEISRNILEISNVLKNNLFNLKDMIKQILISQNQKELVDKKIVDLEKKLQDLIINEEQKDNQLVSDLNQKISELEKKLVDLQKEPVKETVAPEEPAKEEPVQEVTVPQEEPVQEEPAKEEPAKEEPVQEEPAKEEPVEENNIVEQKFENVIQNMQEIDNINQEINNNYSLGNLHHILKRTEYKNENSVDINRLKEFNPKDIIALVKKATALDQVTVSKDIKTTYSTHGIKMEEQSVDSKEMTSTNIGTIVNVNYSFNNVKLYGQGIKNQFIFESENDASNIRNLKDLQVTDDVISIFDEKTALKIASIFYSNVSEMKAEFCYYGSKKSEYLIPSYKISGKVKDSELIETFIPANVKYIPLIKFTEIDVNAIENEENIDFNLTFLNLKSIEKVQLVSSFGNKYLNKNQVTISVPKNVTQNIFNTLKYVDIALTSINIHGFSYNISLLVDLSKYIGLFKIIDMGVVGNGESKIHNYGVEWGESELGATIFSNYINTMDSYGVHKEYVFNSQLSKERNFIDLNSSANGLDHRYVDNVDTLAYIGHGAGDGFTFLTSDNDNKLTYLDAEQGNAWGNKNLEFMALMSCQVLKEIHGGLLWNQRWGRVFNGLHLICGFQTNANTGEHQMLSNFANNQYGNKMTILNSWLNAANLDQPEGREAVVMGPLINRSNINIYNSIESTLPNLNRAYWNDKAWGIENGPGYKITKNDIKGFWRIVFTV